jgi:hypothetical protein
MIYPVSKLEKGLAMLTSLGIVKKIIKEYEWATQKDTFFANLKHLVKGKKIVIVGSSPSLIGSNLGNVIDSHDLVIRINGTLRIKNSQDFGQRTDCVFLGAAFSTPEMLRSRIPEIDKNCILMSTTKNKSLIDEHFNSQTVVYYPQHLPKIISKEVEKKSGQPLWDKPFRPPRSGFVAVASICHFAEPKSVTVIGMSKDEVAARMTIDEKSVVKNYDEELLLSKHCEPNTEIKALLHFLAKIKNANWLDR